MAYGNMLTTWDGSIKNWPSTATVQQHYQQSCSALARQQEHCRNKSNVGRVCIVATKQTKCIKSKASQCRLSIDRPSPLPGRYSTRKWCEIQANFETLQLRRWHDEKKYPKQQDHRVGKKASVQRTREASALAGWEHEKKRQQRNRLIRIWRVQITQNQLPNGRHFINVFLPLHSLRTVNRPWLFFLLSIGFVGSLVPVFIVQFFLSIFCFHSLWSLLCFFCYSSFSAQARCAFFRLCCCLLYSVSYQTHCILFTMSVMTKCIRFEVTISVMALWLCSRAFNFTSIQHVSVHVCLSHSHSLSLCAFVYMPAYLCALCVCVYEFEYRACGHHSVHLTVENKLEVRMIILFVELLLLLFCRFHPM